MPMKNMGKPNTSSQLKTNNKLMSIPRAAAQKASRHGEVASNNKIVSGVKGGQRHNSSGPKRGKRMY